MVPGRTQLQPVDHTDERAHARPDLFIHALAQLPRSVEVDVRATTSEREALKRLGEAYGVDSRVRFADVSDVAAANGLRQLPAADVMSEIVDSLDVHGQPVDCRRGADDVFAGERIAIVTNLPTHYRVPLFNRVSRRLVTAGAHLRVLFTSPTPPARRWMVSEPIEFDHERLLPTGLRLGATPAPRHLGSRIRSFGPTLVLVPGFSPAVAMRAALAARRIGAPYGIWSGAIPDPPSWREELQRRQRTALLRHASFAISYGHLSAEYMRELAPELPIVYGRNTTSVPAGEPSRFGDAVVEVLAVGQAIHRKGLDVAIAAFEQLKNVPCRLTIIGGGSELDQLRQRAQGLANVRLLGAVASDRTLDAYREADVFLFPTRHDVFGLVLVEAMGAGLATIVSSACGAVADLALRDHNCVVIDGHEPADWAVAIRELVEDPARRVAVGRQAHEMIQRRWRLDHAADAMIAGLRLGTLSRASPRGGR